MNNRIHGWSAFAAVMMVLAGTYLLIQGIVAMVSPAFFVGGEGGLLMATFLVWGVGLAILGVLKLLTGIALFSGRMWARTLGVVLATISAVLQLGFLSAFPLWSFVIIAMNIAVIYGLTAGSSMMTRREASAEEEPTSASYQAGRSDAARAAPTQRSGGGAHERPEHGAPSGTSG